MEYKKKYKEAQKWIESIYPELNHEQQMEAEAFFPELKESEDERIRKEILQSIRDNMVVIHKDKCIAWLEKQEGCEYIKKDWLEHIKQSWYKEGFIDGKYSGGTSKEWTINDAAIFKEIIDFLENGTAKLQHDLIKYANWLKIQFTPIEKQGKQFSVDKLEPKFHKGEWIVWQDKCYKVNYNGCGYVLFDQNGLSTSLEYGTIDENAHLWTINDAKPGDVLACNNGWTCIFKTLVNDETFSSYCFMDNTKWFCETGSECHTLKEEFVKAYNGKIYPATKEQRNLLFQKMKEAGYRWDEEKKELKKINTYCQENCKGFQETGRCFADGECKAKREAEQKPAWSEEDENKIDTIISVYHPSPNIVDWLKSLKQRIGWKPSDEQIQCLYDAIKHYQTNGYPASKLNELYEQMSKIYKL